MTNRKTAYNTGFASGGWALILINRLINQCIDGGSRVQLPHITPQTIGRGYFFLFSTSKNFPPKTHFSF
jgi:hypothetical protein